MLKSLRRHIMMQGSLSPYSNILYGYRIDRYNGFVADPLYCVLLFTEVDHLMSRPIDWYSPGVPRGNTGYTAWEYGANKNSIENFLYGEQLRRPNFNNVHYVQVTFSISGLDDSYLKYTLTNTYIFKGKNVV